MRCCSGMHKYEVKIKSSAIVDAVNEEEARRIVSGATSLPTASEVEAQIQEEIITAAEVIEIKRLDDSDFDLLDKEQ